MSNNLYKDYKINCGGIIEGWSSLQQTSLCSKKLLHEGDSIFRGKTKGS